MKIIQRAFLLVISVLVLSCSGQDKSEATVFFLKGNLFFKEGQYEQAIHFYDEAIKKYPRLADVYLNKGLALAKSGKAAEAYNVFSTALDKDNSFHEARLARAETALVLGRYNQAKDDLALLVNTYQDSTRFYLIRGNLMVDQNNHSAAMADFDKAVMLDPANVEALVNRGALLFEAGKTELARTDFQKALDLNPTQKEALNNLGLVTLREGDPGNALQLFDQVLIRVPNDPYALNNKGEALLQLGQPEEALKALERSLELKEDNAHTLKNLGVYYLNQEEYQKAVTFFDQAVALEQHVPGLHGLAGKAHWHRNDLPGACKLWSLGKILKDSLASAEFERYCN